MCFVYYTSANLELKRRLSQNEHKMNSNVSHFPCALSTYLYSSSGLTISFFNNLVKIKS